MHAIMQGKYEERMRLDSEFKSLKKHLDDEIRTIIDVRDSNIAAARQTYLRQVMSSYFHDPDDKQTCKAEETYKAETRNRIAECHVQIQEAVAMVQPCLDRLQHQLTNIDSCCEFSLNVVNLASERKQINGVKWNDPLAVLYDKIAEKFAIPISAVQLRLDLNQSVFLGPDDAMKSLAQLGASMDSQLTLMYAEFSVNVLTLAGEAKQVNTKSSDTLIDLSEKIAEKFAIPSFAVRLCHNGELLGAESTSKSLAQLGMTADSQVMLMQIWGWAKPQLDLLSELEKQWERRPPINSCSAPCIPILQRQPSVTA